MDRRTHPHLTRLALVVCAGLINSPAFSDPISDFFQSLRQPGTGHSCCNISDCAFTTARWDATSQRWIAIGRGGEEVVIDPQIVLDRPSIDERAVLCQSKAEDLCFVPPLQGS